MAGVNPRKVSLLFASESSGGRIIVSLYRSEDDARIDAPAGRVEAGRVPIARWSSGGLGRLDCMDDLRGLASSARAALVARPFVVTETSLDHDLRRAGLGAWMYAEAARLAWESARAAIVADACDRGTTTDSARRVWGSRSLSAVAHTSGLAAIWRPELGPAEPKPPPGVDLVRRAGPAGVRDNPPGAGREVSAEHPELPRILRALALIRKAVRGVPFDERREHLMEGKFYAKRVAGMEPRGVGSDRIVYLLPGNREVVKLTFGRKRQSRHEVEFWQNAPDEDLSLLCPVVAAGEGWIVMPAAKTWDEGDPTPDGRDVRSFDRISFDADDSNCMILGRHLVLVDYGNGVKPHQRRENPPGEPGSAAELQRAMDAAREPPYRPQDGATVAGEWDRSSGDPRWRQSHRQLVADALRSWKGDPVSVRLHFRDEELGAPLPGSGSGKILRARAGALLWELAHNARPATRVLYRGSHLVPDGPQSWSESRKVAELWARKNGGRVFTRARGEPALRVADYTASAFESEREWVAVGPSAADVSRRE